MTSNCDLCGGGPSVLRISGLVVCDVCCYDPEKEIVLRIAEGLKDITVGGGTRRETLATAREVEAALKKHSCVSLSLRRERYELVRKNQELLAALEVMRTRLSYSDPHGDMPMVEALIAKGQ